jgi:hypothetical protein
VCERCGKPIYRLYGDDITLFNARYRHCVAFQVALSLWSGVNFVCIDETDTLDAQGRRALMETLIGLTALEQAICIGTDERSNVPDVDGLSVFMVTSADDGTAAVQVLSQPQPQAAAA